MSAGVRLDYYPLMSRVGRGIETLDYASYVVTLGGIGGQPKDAGSTSRSGTLSRASAWRTA